MRKSLKRHLKKISWEVLKNAGYIHSKSSYPVVGGDDTFQICYCIIKRGFHVGDVSIKIGYGSLQCC